MGWLFGKARRPAPAVATSTGNRGRGRPKGAGNRTTKVDKLRQAQMEADAARRQTIEDMKAQLEVARLQRDLQKLLHGGEAPPADRASAGRPD